MPTLADAVARILAVNGVRRVFGLPGGEIAEIMAACRRLGLAFVLTRHENAACIMASVTGELTRRPGVVLATVGPGATNLVNGVANAFLERAPLLVISGQVATSVAPALPHQRLDLEALFRPITKWSHTLTGKDAASTVRRALDNAVDSGRRRGCEGGIRKAEGGKRNWEGGGRKGKKKQRTSVIVVLLLSTFHLPNSALSFIIGCR